MLLNITPNGMNSCTPKFGHQEFWKNAQERFNLLKKGADKKQGEI